MRLAAGNHAERAQKNAFAGVEVAMLRLAGDV
jgi:hypothetical protein